MDFAYPDFLYFQVFSSQNNPIHWLLTPKHLNKQLEFRNNLQITMGEGCQAQTENKGCQINLVFRIHAIN